jgi:hypothetical protein
MAGAHALSLEPPFLDEPQKGWPEWPTIFNHCESELTSGRSWRYSWWQHWSIIAQYQLPYRYHWVIAANTFNRGYPVNESIINETATIALNICASGLMAGLMSPSRPWVRFDPAIPNWRIPADGRRWLDELRDRFLAVIAGSNWYTAFAEAFKDVAPFGTSPMIINADHDDVLRCYVPVAGEYFLKASSRQVNDGIIREYVQTVQQIVEYFGLKHCPEEVRQAWRTGGGSLDREFVICHMIEPNFDLSDRSGKRIKVLPYHFTYREIYWVRGHAGEGPLSIRGFQERPFIVIRWSKTSNDPYGRSPGMDALGGARQIQQQERRLGEFIDKIVRPPMGADVSLENKPSSIISGEITFMNTQSDGRQSFFPLFQMNPMGVEPMLKSIERVEQRLGRIFYTDTFLAITQMEGIQPRNEMELQQRVGEKIQMLGPVIELFEEQVGPAVQRALNLMARRNLMPPMPRSLAGIPMVVTYTSIMKMLQRAAETAGMERTAAVVGSLTEGALAAKLPVPIRTLNLDEFARDYADKMMFPARLVYSQAEVAEHDRIREQQAQMQQAMEATLPAVQAAKGLSETQVGGGQNALEAVLGTGGGTGGG